MVTSVPASPGGDKVLVAPGGDVAMEGTAQPGATNCSWDTLGHLSDVTGDATTAVTSVPASPGGDKVLVATAGDVAMEGTEDPSATGDPRDTLGCVTEASGDATTMVTSVPASPGGDKVLVATAGGVAMAVTEAPGATNCSWDTLGRVPDVPGDATTTSGDVTTSPGGDKVLVATAGGVAMEGTEDPSATGDPRDTLGHLNDVTGDATTTVTSVPASPGGDKVLVAPGGDVAMEVTAQPGATNCSRDTLGHLSDVIEDATSTTGAVTTSPGGDKVLVATTGGVAMEVTEDPSATGDPRDTLGHLNDVIEDATTMVTSVPASPGSDKVLVATSGDVAMEVTEDPSATGDPRDTLGRVTEAPGDATTTVTSDPVSPGGDKVLVAPGGDVAMEGTAQPGATNCSWDTLGRVPDVPGDATTTTGAVTTSPGSDKSLLGPGGDVAMEGTAQPSATNCSWDTLGHLSDVTRDATSTTGVVTTSPGSDKVPAATAGGVASAATSGDVTAGDDVTAAIMVAPGGAISVGGPGVNPRPP
ncbi:uncharacterized protein LOC131590129 [Poecile atricapillus]|uniref:uncharacterized protein LOC131590129 n=1 Tax=Poecile atricapillus TaxID=48891 RepID=UPI002738FFB6|nr:uncharacterized protein LOC131590129 [Poecile atricapillus]